MISTRNTAWCLSLCLLAPASLRAQDAPLEPAGSIALPAVKGRIDHFGVDVGQHRLFIAAIVNDTLEVLDLRSNARAASLPGFGEPQGVLYVPALDRLVVANGGANRVDILDAKTLKAIHRIDGLADADNVRYDAPAGRVYVGYGGGALRLLDPATGRSAGEIRLAGHPESFQLERNGARIFVNVPTARQVAVVDRVKRAVVATWAVPARANFPMALDESGRRIFVGAREPAVLLVYDMDSGKVVARRPIGEDTDDLYFDPARKRLYIICGGGRIDVLRQESPDRYSAAGSVRTAVGARTGLFVPEEASVYVAAPKIGADPARVLIYRVR